MSRRFLLLFAGVVLFALLLGSRVYAGGWAVITLDEWPGSIPAGTRLQVGFTVRQHGIQPMEGLTPTVTLRSPVSGEKARVPAAPQGEVGHYTALLDLPDAGEWAWSIQAFTMDQPMPPLQVTGGAPADGGWLTAPLSPRPLAVLIGAAGVLLAAALVRRSRPRWALGLVVTGILAGGAGLLYTANRALAVQAAQQPPALAPQELGRILFTAKGCVTCHLHAAVPNRAKISFDDLGPDLTAFPASPEFLRRWLKDPQAVKPGTSMPTLGLREAEIEALIAFLNADPGRV